MNTVSKILATCVESVGGHGLVLHPDPVLCITTIAESCVIIVTWRIGPSFRTAWCPICHRLVHCHELPSGKMAVLFAIGWYKEWICWYLQIIMCDCTHRINVNQSIVDDIVSILFPVLVHGTCCDCRREYWLCSVTSPLFHMLPYNTGLCGPLCIELMFMLFMLECTVCYTPAFHRTPCTFTQLLSGTNPRGLS